MTAQSAWKDLAATSLVATTELPKRLQDECLDAVCGTRNLHLAHNLTSVVQELRDLFVFNKTASPQQAYAASYHAANYMASARGSSVGASDHFGYMINTFPEEFGRTDLNSSAPVWNGAKTGKGKTLLVHAVKMQGAGDVFQFAPLVMMAKDQGGFDTVVFEVPKRMIPLFEKQGLADIVVGKGDELPPHDARVPMMTLPSVLGINLQTHKAPGEYLRPDWALGTAENNWINENIRRAQRADKFVVGLAWQGDAGNFALEPHRSLNLAQLHSLFSIENAQFICLQNPMDVNKKDSPLAAQFAALNDQQRDKILVLPDGFDKSIMFGDTMHAMHAMNMVVSTDTGIAHAAGASGARLVVMAQHLPELRYSAAGPVARFEEAAVSALNYYERASLIQQPAPGKWAEVVETVRDEIVGRSSDNSSLHADMLPTRGRPLDFMYKA